MVDLNLDNPVVRGLVFYSAILIAKMFFMAFLTAIQRFSKGVFANREDRVSRSSKVAFDDDDVERVRRNHLNDLENIPAFIITGVLYSLTGPSLQVALWHFRIFTFSRILHTFAYQLPLPQPSRAVCFVSGMFTCLSMLGQTIMHTF